MLHSNQSVLAVVCCVCPLALQLMELCNTGNQLPPFQQTNLILKSTENLSILPWLLKVQYWDAKCSMLSKSDRDHIPQSRYIVEIYLLMYIRYTVPVHRLCASLSRAVHKLLGNFGATFMVSGNFSNFRQLFFYREISFVLRQ